MSAKKQPHQWTKLKRIPWQICKCCGLVALRNEATNRAIRAGCDR